MADQRTLFESMHKVGGSDPKVTAARRQRRIFILLIGLFLFATGLYATRTHIVHPIGATTVLAH